MAIGLGSYALVLLAGMLSTLSPCVLPIVPVLLTSAVNAHRRGVWLLAPGLSLSFAGVGLFIATAGISIDLEAPLLRSAGAVLMIAFGILLLSAPLQRRFASATSGLSDGGTNLLNRWNPEGLRGQFMVGLMLGVVWSPCVGPTMGAAATLAAQGQRLAQVALLMLLFGFGAVLLMLGLSIVSGLDKSIEYFAVEHSPAWLTAITARY